MKTYLKDLTPEEVIRRLKAGEVLKEDDSKTITKLVEGVWCTYYQNGSIGLNDGFNLDSDARQYYYFETPDELKLEVGKCYKTRDGRKAFISDYNSATKYFRGAVVEFLDLVIWTNDGMYLYTTKESNLDLISEWSDYDVESNKKRAWYI